MRVVRGPEGAPNELSRNVLLGHGIDVFDVHCLAPEHVSICRRDLVRDRRHTLDHLAMSVDRFAVAINDAANVRVFVRSRASRRRDGSKKLRHKADRISGAIAAVLLPLRF